MRREVRRLISFFLVLFFSVCFNFFLPRLMPGNPIQAMIGRMMRVGSVSGQEDLALYYIKLFAMEGTMWDQFVAYITQLLQGNLMISFNYFPTTVSELIMRALPFSIGIMVTSTILAWVIGTLIGGVVGWRGEKSKLTWPISFVSVMFANLPYFLLALIFVFLFAFTWPILPISGAWSITAVPAFTLVFILDLLEHAIGPITCITLSQISMWFLHMRALVQDVKHEDYILYGEARGLKGRRMLTGYAIKNCLLPQVTEFGMVIGWVFSGSLLTEIVFNYPGLGQLLYTSILTLDYPVIMGITLLTIIAINIALLVIDLIIVPLLDPRVRQD